METMNAQKLVVPMPEARQELHHHESLAAYVDRLSGAASARADDPSAQPLRQ